MERLERPSTAGPESDRLDALVVLGCRVNPSGPSRALESRLALAHELSRTWGARDRGDSAQEKTPSIVLSGGRSWDGRVEAEIMAEWLVARGTAPAALILERESLTTRQNARKVGELLTLRGWRRIGLVTSDFHMRRAIRLFRQEGLSVEPFGARSDLGFFTEKRLIVRELCAFVLGHFEPR